jgi:hypothetical protein
MTASCSIHLDSFTAAVNVEPPAINTQNRACLSISSFFKDKHNTSSQNGIETTN